MSRRISFVFSALLLCAGARAGSWARIPVWGADVTALALDPFEAGRVYCGTSRGNVYVSQDRGESWTATRPGNQFPGYVVSTLRPDVRTPGRLWAALSGAEHGALLAVSGDRGATWTVLARWEHSVNARAFAQSAADPLLLACGGDDGVFLSRDGGKSWTASGTDIPGLSLIQSLAFDPGEPQTLFAGTYRQAFRTRDAGLHWSRVADGMVLDATVYSFDFQRDDPSKLWVSTCGWVYRSDNGGDHWTRFTSGFTNRRTPVVRLDPVSPGVLFAGTVGGLHRSEDGGDTWQRVTRETLDISVLEIDPRTDRLYLGTLGEGMFSSDDRGATLVPASRGLAEARVPALAADPDDPSRVLFLRAYGGAGSGVWESVGDLSRQISADSPPGAFALSATRLAGRPLWLCASASALRVSFDGGHHFTPPEKAPRGRILRLFGAPLDNPVVVTDEGVFTTGDGNRFERVGAVTGDPWEASLVTGASDRPVLEVRTSNGVYRQSGGAFIQVGRRVLSGGMFLKDAGKESSPYFRFSVAGGTLTLLRGGSAGTVTLPRDELQVSDAVLAGDGTLYVATIGDGVFLYRPERAASAAAGAVPSAPRGTPELKTAAANR
ncbi:MAG: WD40/YVTN/BNR-like repeat-containing protein [Verrucomicrobiota bacterium]